MGQYVSSGPCPECGSSDANATYADGSTHCHKCHHDTQPEHNKSAVDIDLDLGTYASIDSRSIRLSTCQKYGYRVAKLKGRPCHLALGRTGGKPCAWNVRDAKSKAFHWIGKARKLDLYGRHLWGPGKRLVITEGVLDCLSIAQAMGLKHPVVSLMNGTGGAKIEITDNLEWINKFQEVVLAFDDDDPGKEAIEKVAPLIEAKVFVMRYTGHNDANDLLMNQGAPEVARCLQQAEEWRPDGIVNGSRLLDVLLHPPKKGVELCYPKLSEMLQGADEKRLYLWTAGSGIGKSTAVHEVCYDFVHRHGMKCGVMALEESVREAAMRHLSIHANKPLHLAEHDPMLLRELYQGVLKDGRYEFYDHFGTTDPAGLIGKMAYMRRVLRCDVILLDHISIVMSGATGQMYESEAKRIDVFMTQLRSFIEATGTMVQAIVHLKRPQVGKSWNEGRRVSLTDLRGSASLEQLSDAVIALERDQQGNQQNVSRIRLLKNRKTGKTGLADVLKYVPNTGRLIAAEEEEWANVTQKTATAPKSTIF